MQLPISEILEKAMQHSTDDIHLIYSSFCPLWNYDLRGPNLNLQEYVINSYNNTY